MKTVTLTFETDEYNEESIAAMVESRMKFAIESQFKVAVNEIVRDRVEKLTDEIARTTISEAVRVAVESGWQETNEYGEARGNKITLKERISKLLNSNAGGYSERITLGEKHAKDVIEKALRADFGKELEAARVEFRKMLDNTVKDRLAQAVKSALGVSS